MTAGPRRSPWRVAVLYEPGRGGAAALALARQLADSSPLELTVIAVAPQTTLVHGCCGMSAREYNRIIRDAAAEELEQAQERLEKAAASVSLQLLVERRDPSLEEWIAAKDFELVLLPARRRLLRADTHPAAARVRRSTSAEVRVIHATEPQDRLEPADRPITGPMLYGGRPANGGIERPAPPAAGLSPATAASRRGTSVPPPEPGQARYRRPCRVDRAHARPPDGRNL